MKILTILLAVCVSAVLAQDVDQDLTPQQLARAQSIKRRCVDETGVDERFIAKLKEGVYEPDERFHCFAACALRKYGVMRSTGGINRKSLTTTLQRALPPSVAAEVKTCVAKAGKSGCETGALYLDCVKDKSAVDLL